MARILVIDDDEGLRRIICRGLTEAGHEPVEAGDGRAGLEVAKLDHPQLIITDIAMPDVDGIETIIELRNLDPGPAIIAISGLTGSDGFTPLDDANLLGADAAFSKPFALNDLLATVERLLLARDSGPG